MEYLKILIKIRKIIRSINLESKRIEKQFGISIPQLLVLQFISEQDDSISNAKEIKNYINLNASTISGIISRLNSKGLIAKLQKSKDKRVTHLALTAKGLKILNESPITLQEKLTSRLSKLNKEEITILNQNIDLLIKIMEVEDVDASPLITIKDFPTSK